MPAQNSSKSLHFCFMSPSEIQVKSCDLTEMMKDQLICKIYHKKDADDGFRLLQTVLESEKCLIIADGLDEWKHPENIICTCTADEKVIPFRNSANRATILITTRPWRLSQFRMHDSKIDKYLEIDGAENPLQLVKNVLTILNEGSEDKRTPEAFMKMVSEKDLDGLLSAPIIITQLVCLWFEGISLTNSTCDIYAGVINMLSCRQSCLQREHSIPEIELPSVLKAHECFLKYPMVYIALARLAYITLFSVCLGSYVVFSSDTVYSVFSGLDSKQVEFALKSGLLTEKKSNSFIKRTSHFSFFHKTVQEYLAALHLCLNGNDYNKLSKEYALDNEQNLFGDVSQVFIFICGMKPELGVQMSSWINSSVPKSSVCSRSSGDTLVYKGPIPNNVKILQQLIVSGLREAQTNNHGDIQLTLAHFQFDAYMKDVISLKELMSINKCRIQSLYINACNHQLTTYECNNKVSVELLQEVFTSSCDFIKAVELSFRDGQYDLSQCHMLEYLYIRGKTTTALQVDTTNITTCELFDVCLDVEESILNAFKQDTKERKLQHLTITNVKNVKLLCDTLPSLSQLYYIHIRYTNLGELLLLPSASITSITLVDVTMTAEAVRKLVETMENQKHSAKCMMRWFTIEPASHLVQIKNYLDSSDVFTLDLYDIYKRIFNFTKM